ncbi:ABC transporter permease [Phyllobacterium endophyticum]|uniref:ABC transporter permease n=1 Tax=Phyllobacterium endophyticum TaxID=1149773 RepID=A0A2P7ARY3_9HYPH|nr:ABC transporter permease [Phyllobacterium endophyticum]MBB3236690.1 octopine/nopaline transport system permease protein [Phyllobacterium endophyticum]PSH56985.1 ABC transporter permease [Phyllobacterium endophyticum]TYR39672.1 ABC transporter permease [Phyllobacterium endophyticum]
MNLALMVDVLPLLCEGMLLTAQLTLASVAIGLFIAVPLALLRTSPWPVFSHAIFLYTFLFRGTPLLVQLFLVYYGAGQVEWIRSSVAWSMLREPFWCALITFSLNNAAYTTEILRGGLRAVPSGEVEAAKALGMPYALRIRRIILPAGFRLALPAYANEVVLMLKASSLASTITLMELTGTARKIVAQTFSPYEVFISAALIYLGFTFVIVHLFGRLETRMAKHQKRAEPGNNSQLRARTAGIISASQKVAP